MNFDGVHTDVVVGTRPNNTGFITAGDLLSEIEKLRGALESIADDDPTKGYDHVSRATVALGREAPRW